MQFWEWISNICLRTSMSATATKYNISTMLPLLPTQLNSMSLSLSQLPIYFAQCNILYFYWIEYIPNLVCISKSTTCTYSCWISAPFALKICCYYSKMFRFNTLSTGELVNGCVLFKCSHFFFILSSALKWKFHWLLFVLTLSMCLLSSWADFNLWWFRNNFFLLNRNQNHWNTVHFLHNSFIVSKYMHFQVVMITNQPTN